MNITYRNTITKASLHKLAYRIENKSMIIKYSKVFDLVFHALTYMKVDNASNLYNFNYVEIMSKQKQKESFTYDISSAMSTLCRYYNANFERLGMINFLPFYCADYNDLKNCFMQNECFTKEDIDNFIKPFINALDNEADFFFPWWDKQDMKYETRKRLFTDRLKRDFEPFAPIFEYYKKSPKVFLSYVLTANGRGFGGFTEYFTALAPFPKNDTDNDLTFIFLLHEMTHQFTDNLIKGDISMSDGSHNLSENIVMLTDYYLIKALNPERIDDYFKWIQTISHNNNPLNEEFFFSVFSVGSEVKTAIHDVVSMICGNKMKTEL